MHNQLSVGSHERLFSTQQWTADFTENVKITASWGSMKFEKDPTVWRYLLDLNLTHGARGTWKLYQTGCSTAKAFTHAGHNRFGLEPENAVLQATSYSFSVLQSNSGITEKKTGVDNVVPRSYHRSNAADFCSKVTGSYLGQFGAAHCDRRIYWISSDFLNRDSL
jgi:hypothetical protein